MMKDYEYVFGTALRDRLIARVNGGVKTWITEDTLYVSIRREELGITWSWSHSDFANRLIYGYSVDEALAEVIREYNQFIKKNSLSNSEQRISNMGSSVLF